MESESEQRLTFSDRIHKKLTLSMSGENSKSISNECG